MKVLLALIAKLYGKGAISKTIGSRTNVIKLADNDAKRFIKNELNIEAAGEAAIQKGLKDAESLIADIPKMNDQEILTFTGNLKRLDQKVNPPQAEVLDITTQQKVSPEGIASLTETVGQKNAPGTLMGDLELNVNKLKASGKQLEDIAKEKGGQSLDDIMKGEGQAQQGMAQAQKEGFVKATANDIMIADMKSGKFPATKEMQQEILEGSPKSLDYFRRFYGEDALEVLDSLTPDLAKMRTSREAADFAKKQYNFEAKMDRAPGSIDLEDAAKAEDEFGITSLKNPSETYKPFGLDLNRQEKVDWLIKNVDPEAEVTIPSPGALQNMLDSGREDLIDHFWEIHTSNIGRKPVVDIDTSDLKNPELVKFMMEKKARKPKLVDPEDIDDVIPDPEDPEGFAVGGRVDYAYGSGLKLIQLLNKAKKSLKQAIKESADDIIPTGDSKLDADMAVDNLLEKLGVDREAVDGYDILDAYGEAYKTVTGSMLKTRKSASVFSEQYLKKIDDEIIKEGLYTRKEWAKAPETIKNKIRGQMDPDWKEANFGEDYDFDQVRGKELEEGIGGLKINMDDVMDDVRLMKEKGLQGTKSGDYDKFLEMKLSGELGPQKQMQTIKMELFNKYSKYLDDETMDVIQASNDPQKVAESYANVREAALLSDRGVPTEEIVDTIIKTPRTKQANGTSSQGLDYLMGVERKGFFWGSEDTGSDGIQIAEANADPSVDARQGFKV